MKIQATPSAPQHSAIMPARPVPVEHLRTLVTSEPPRPGAPRHLAAASGLVRTDTCFLVAADDEGGLGVFPSSGNGPGKWFPLFDGVLPADPKARKAVKKDLESLTLLPPSSALPHGAVLALGSGSTENRNVGVVVALNAQGQPVGRPREVNLARLYDAIAPKVGALNIEGSVVLGPTLRLLQRGNGSGGINAFVDVELAALPVSGGTLPASALKSIQPVELGSLHGVRLGFTDASPLPDGRMVFAAAAEDTQSTYHDGECTGSAVGIADAQGRVLALHALDGKVKVEGISVDHVSGGRVQVTLVADGDDPEQPAPMMRAGLPLT